MGGDEMSRQELKRCKYCGGSPYMITNAETNHEGRNGFKTTIKCLGCCNRIERWVQTYDESIIKASYNWNGGTENV